MKISIIIPAHNEEHLIEKIIRDIRKKTDPTYADEIIVVDGQSSDQTATVAKNCGARVLHAHVARRSTQMNMGANAAKNDVLYFVHADSMLPEAYDKKIMAYVNQGYESGCFRSKFDSNHWFLRSCSYCTKFKPIFCRGGGQTLFVTKDVFRQVEGYEDQLQVMEEYNLILKLKKIARFKIIPDNVIISSRKYKRNGTFKLYAAYTLIFILYFLGISQNRLSSTYKKLIR